MVVFMMDKTRVAWLNAEQLLWADMQAESSV
jgi:hypothetical protein